MREIRDLLFNTDQAWQLIDEHARLLRGTNAFPTFLDADRCQWDYNPKMASATYSPFLGKAGQGRFYQWPDEPRQPGLQWVRSADEELCGRPRQPAGQPRRRCCHSSPANAWRMLGPPNYPLNRLTLPVSAHYSPATYPFAAMKWRVGEITDTNAPAFRSRRGHAHYEITRRLGER